MRNRDTLIQPFTTHKLVDCNIFYWGKGGFKSIQAELQGAYQGSAPVSVLDADGLQQVVHDMFDVYKGNRITYEPEAWVDVVMEKDGETSVGYPLGAYFPDYLTFLQAYIESDQHEEDAMPSESELKVLCDDLQDAENKVLQLKCPQSYWKALAKEDKYSAKKVLSAKYRMVSIGSYFLLCLCRRWLSKVDKHVKEIVSQFHVLGDEAHYQSHVLSRLQGRHSMGVDYTGFDKHSCRAIVIHSLMFLDYMSNYSTPRPIMEYIILNIANPTTVISCKDDGVTEVYNLSGTNPSGQFHTSTVNSASHLIHNCYTLHKVFKVPVIDYLRDLSIVRSCMTGDDGLETCETATQTLAVVEMLAHSVEKWFGIPAKVEGLLDESTGRIIPFPPTVLAPYLSQVCVFQPEAGYYYKIPSHPKRMLARLIYIGSDCKGDIEELMFSRCTNIANEMHNLGMHSYLHPDIPENEVFLRMNDYFRSYGVVPKSVQDTSGRVFRIPKGQILI